MFISQQNIRITSDQNQLVIGVRNFLCDFHIWATKRHKKHKACSIFVVLLVPLCGWIVI